jgi:hypothetical protein
MPEGDVPVGPSVGHEGVGVVEDGGVAVRRGQPRHDRRARSKVTAVERDLFGSQHVHGRRGPAQYLLDHCLSVLTAIPNAVEQARHGGQGMDDTGDGVPSGLVAADQHVVAIEQHVLGIEVALGKQRADQVVSGPAPASCDQLVEVHKDLGVRLAGRHSVEQLVLASEGVIGQPMSMSWSASGTPRISHTTAAGMRGPTTAATSHSAARQCSASVT